MLRPVLAAFVLLSASAEATPWFDGEPEFVDEKSRALAARVLAAHGGMTAMAEAKSLRFSFFTKVIGGQIPFYSIESVDLETGRAHIEWPFWQASAAWDGERVWAHRWPMPMPAGFFIRLTSSFITLPWQMHHDGANIGPVGGGRLPDDDTDYEVLRVTFDARSPSIPGTFYELFVDPESGLMKAIRFDINHPGMVANPTQPIGPNLHVFDEYRSYGGAMIPSFYQTYGRGSANGGTSTAYHFAWDLQLGESFDTAILSPPEGATFDDVSMQWWYSAKQATAVAIDPFLLNKEEKTR